MTRRILLRAGKDPFRVLSAENTLANNLIGNNSGNLLFSTAAFKLLSSPGTEVVANGLTADPAAADRINDEYDCFVLPLANAFRAEFLPHLRRFTSLIQRLTIPVVVLSCGAQSTADLDMAALQELDGPVTDFMKAVLDRSAAVGVRGEFTQAYLKRLGFTQVEVIGCPSMFLFGDRLSVTRKASSLKSGSRIAINGAANVRAMGPILAAHHRRYPNLTYVTQGKVDLELLLWGASIDAAKKQTSFPVHPSHPLYQENKIRFFLDPWTWMRYLRDYHFSFGTRIHGNIVALLAGTPAYVLAPDSRTLELARYFEIPHRKIAGAAPDLDAATLYREADYDGLNRHHAERFARFLAFVQKNGLDHIFAYPEAARKFDERMDRVAFPPPVETATSASPLDLVERMRWLRKKQADELKSIRERLQRLEEAVRPAPGPGGS